MTQFEVEDIKTGRRYTCYVLAKLTGQQVYRVDKLNYTPAEFWEKFRQVTK